MIKREYNHSLIGQLENDHRKIMDIYEEIKAHFHEDANHLKIKEKLHKLKTMLQMHIDFEDSLLYPYLSSGYRNDGENMTFIEKANAEMLELASNAFKFISDCTDEMLFAQNREKFKEDFSAIGEILSKRIEFEETSLYPLYVYHH